MTAEEFEACGLYDPDAPNATNRLELLFFLSSLGASLDDLIEFRDDLPALASVVALRGRSTMTMAEVADQAGLPESRVVELTRAAGFPTPDPADRVFSTGFLELATTLTAAEALFGSATVLQLVRVMGATTARLADAIVSAFLVNVEPAARKADNVHLAIARANAEAVDLLPVVTNGLEVLLRQHLIAARRTIMGEGNTGVETRTLSVGFVDLVGSTELAQRIGAGELGETLTEFEHLVVDLVTESGGRVVKLIGDEVLFTAPDEITACTIGLELCAALHSHPRVPPVRVGLASGEVMLRDGDVFGPVVNLAARAVTIAGPSDVVAPASLVSAADVPSKLIGTYELKGFAAPVELHCLVGHPTSPEAAG